MKIKLFLLSLLLCQGLLLSQTVTIDLSTGKNDDGTLMNAPPPDVTDGVSVTDSDWSVLRPGEAVQVSTKTRHTYTGWSTPILTVTAGTAAQSRWITDKDSWGPVGDGFYHYYSKSFTIPDGVTNATLNLRSLSFVRNWTYLVRTDVIPNTEEEITRTTWMSDGAKGWLNSRSPEVLNKPLVPGTYVIKVRLYTNNSNVTNALNVHGLVIYTPQGCTSPAPLVNTPITYCQNATASSLSATGTGLLWYTTATGGIGSTVAPTPSTANAGTASYYVSQTINGCESDRAKIDVAVNTIPAAPITSVSQPTCTVGTGAVTLSNLPASSYNIKMNGNLILNNQTVATQTISNLAVGSYSFTVTDALTGCTSPDSPNVNIVLPSSVTPVFNQVNPICIGGAFTLPTTSSNGITGLWSPSINNQATTTYTFTPNPGQCAGTASMTVTVNSGQSPGVILGLNALTVNKTSNYTVSNSISGTWSSSNTSVGTINSLTGEFTALSVGNTKITFVPSDCGISVTKDIEVVNCNPTKITFNLTTGKAGNNIFNNNNNINLPGIAVNTKDDDWKVFSSDFPSIQLDYANVTSGVILNASKITYPFNINNSTYTSYTSDGTIDLYYSGISRGNFISSSFYIPESSYNRRIAIQGFAYKMNNIALVRKADNTSSSLTSTSGTINDSWSLYPQNAEYNTCKRTSSLTTGSTDCSLNTKGENNINLNNRYNDKYLRDSGEYYFDVRDWGSNTQRLAIRVGAIVEYTLDDLCTQVPYGETNQIFCSGSTVSNLLAKNLDATQKDIKWYLEPSGGTALDQFTPLTSGVYYAGLTFNGVTSLNRLPVKVQVLPEAVVNNNQDIALLLNQTIQVPVQGVTSGTWTSLNPAIATVSSSGLITAVSVGKTAIRYTYNDSKCSYDIGLVVQQSINYTLAPNSYIFDTNSDNDGLYIPVKKAYAMWKDTNGLLNDPTVLTGTPKAMVYWEDASGLIRAASDYSLPIIGVGEDAKIKVHIDKAKGEGNAVIAYKIADKIIWSWHVWVTDNPTNGVTYGHVSDNEGNVTTLEKNAKYEAGTVIKSFIPKWMDRNLGAVNRDFIGKDWFKSGGLSYQWGRKDPLPPLIYKNGAMYEVSGSIGVKKHLYDYTKTDVQILDIINRPSVNIEGNIRFSVNNPLTYIHATDTAWFSNSIPNGDNAYRKKIDLWGDSSENATNSMGGTNNTYKPKKPYDPCPNGWRVPSFINNGDNPANYQSPWGRNRYTFSGDKAGGFLKIKPTEVHPHLQGIKMYANLGMDFTNAYTTSAITSGKISRNMGVYPGGGKYVLSTSAQKVYLGDSHEIAISTATIWKLNSANTYYLYGYADAGQIIDQPDSVNYPDMIGRYTLNSGFESQAITGAMSCRCVEDKYTFMYNFPTEFFKEPSLLNYTNGVSDPNSYVVTKSATEQEIKIPVSKAFSVYNQYLSDHGMLTFDNLKANVYWTDNKTLVSNVKIVNAPSNINSIKDSYISVKIPANQSGNSVVSLHNGSVTNPVYWSWHIWVTNSSVSEVKYQTEDIPLPSNANYVNFTNSGSQPMNYSFMDRNLGAIDAFPNVADPSSPTLAELNQISNSGGLQYQWGRKDPIPSFVKVGASFDSSTIATYSIWKSSGPDADGNINQASFTEITDNVYANTYIKRRDIDYGTTGNNKREKLMNSLKYSSENPLFFLIPGNIYAPNTEFNHRYGQDWLYFEPNQMQERWGTGSTKSVFDPCPKGYRIPFISNGVAVPDNATNYIAKSGKGFSPWYNGYYKSSEAVKPYKLFDLGVKQDIGAEIKMPSNMYNSGTSYYLGSTVKNGNIIYGYLFNSDKDSSSDPNAKYKIGNYPVTGMRGFTGRNGYKSGIWTASLESSNGYGKGYNLAFSTGESVSNLYSLISDHPSNALNCRCVKDDFSFGETLGISANKGNFVRVSESYLNKVSSKVEYVSKQIEVYPNPVDSVLNIKVSDNKDYYYEIYNMSGQLVKKGKFENKQTDVSGLISGAYLVRINDSDNVVKIIKN